MRHHALNIRRPAHTKPPRVARAPSLRSLALCTLTLCALGLAGVQKNPRAHQGPRE